MREELVVGKNLADCYHQALCLLQENGEDADCSDWGQRQKELSMTIQVLEPLAEPMISKLFIGGPRELEQYRQEMLDGILDFEVKKGNWAYTYHDRMVNYYIDNTEQSPNHYSLNQLEFIVEDLLRNPSSRRAVVDIRDNSVDAYSDDPACLQHIQYFIRDDKLHCKVLFRSNDACKASFMNMFALIMLQQRIANELDVEMGTYTHRANSFHCYEKDYDMLEGYYKRIKEGGDVASDYIDDWKDMMEEYQEDIENSVKILKNRGTN